MRIPPRASSPSRLLSPSLLLALAALATTTASLQACIPLFAAGAAAGTGALIAEDRRTSGTYLDDEGIELKLGNRVGEKFKDNTHVNATSYNKVVLLTGEVATAAAKAEIGAIAAAVPGVRFVVNELVVGNVTTLTQRSGDTYTTTRVKTRFIDGARFQANHVKVVTEAGIVYLMGIVKRAEAKAAGELASSVSGVKKVVQVFEFLD
jgi:osmotically-inducible protein OsmY